MRVFKLRADGDTYEYVDFELEDIPDEKFWPDYPRRLADTWEPLTVRLHRQDPAGKPLLPGDFPALLLPEEGRWAEQRRAEKQTLLKMEFATFRQAIVQLPAQIVRTGRRIIYRLLSWNPWQHVFFRLLDQLRLPLRCLSRRASKPESGRSGTAAAPNPERNPSP